MTEAAEAPARTYDRLKYTTLEPDWLTKHQPRTIERLREHPDDTISIGLMSEIGDGVFVNWTQCHGCQEYYTRCGCPGGPKEPPSLARSRANRFAKSFADRPELGAEREVTERVINALRERGYYVGEMPAPVIEQVEVPDHSLFLQLFKAAADCEAPEGTQLDDVLATFQEAYDQFTGHVTMEVVSDEQHGESRVVTEEPELTVESLTDEADKIKPSVITRDLTEFDDDF